MALEQRPVVDVETLLCRSAAVFAASAGIIHVAAAGDHTEHPIAAVSFVVVGCVQLAWAGLVAHRPSGRLLVLGAAGSLTVCALWIVSRTAGLPVAFGGEGVETMGVPDTLASFLELLVAGLAAIVAVLPRDARRAAVAGASGERATGVAGAVALLLLVPALVAPPDHTHGGHGHDGINGAAAGHGHVAGATGHGASDAHSAAASTHAHSGSTALVAGVRHAHADAAPGHGSGAGTFGHGPGAAHEDAHVPGAPGHVHGAACQPTAAQQAEADALVAATARGLEKYADSMDAMADGYEPYPPVPANWTQHYVNFKALDDNRILDPEKPESLLYAMTDAGYRPISALFIMSHAGDVPPDVGGCLLNWHAHDRLILRRPGEASSPVMLHVFTVPMKGGPFAHDADPRTVREMWQPFRDFINPWWQDSCLGLPLLPGDPFGSSLFCADPGAH